MKHKKTVLTEEKFISLLKNDLIFNNIKFSHENLFDLISGEIVKIDDNLIILQDIGSSKICNILNKYKKIFE